MAEFLTLEDVLGEASRLGLELSERTFRYYSVLGLLPKPVKLAQGDGRVHYYPPEIMDRLKDIRSLQGQGYSLKQIKEYLAVRPEAARRAPTPSSSSGRLAEALLAAFGQDLPRQAAQRFLSRGPLTDEAEFREAALEYYTDLLAALSDRQSADRELRSALAGRTPLELERIFRPLREWLDRARVRSNQGAPITRRLRQLALDSLAGRPADPSELGSYQASLLSLKARAEALVQAGDPVVRLGAERLSAVLEALARHCRLEQPAQDLAAIDPCARQLDEVSTFLELYQRLQPGQ